MKRFHAILANVLAAPLWIIVIILLLPPMIMGALFSMYEVALSGAGEEV